MHSVPISLLKNGVIYRIYIAHLQVYMHLFVIFNHFLRLGFVVLRSVCVCAVPNHASPKRQDRARTRTNRSAMGGIETKVVQYFCLSPLSQAVGNMWFIHFVQEPQQDGPGFRFSYTGWSNYRRYIVNRHGSSERHLPSHSRTISRRRQFIQSYAGSVY